MNCTCTRPSLVRTFDQYEDLGMVKFRPASPFYCGKCGKMCDPAFEEEQRKLLGLTEESTP